MRSEQLQTVEGLSRIMRYPGAGKKVVGRKLDECKSERVSFRAIDIGMVI